MIRTADAARGKWRGILLNFEVPGAALRNKHGPCPVCGGKDRFRWDDKDGTGSFICAGSCGAGDGFKLLSLLKGWDFPTAAKEVDAIIGRVPIEKPRPPADPEKQRKAIVKLWREARPIEPGDPVWLYLEHRQVEPPQNRDSIRFHPMCPVPGAPGMRTAMLAKVTGPDGKGIQVHRTFITPQGRKAEMDNPRAMMPGEKLMVPGAAVRLSMLGERLGIAEGIETALAASKRFGIPVWASLNSDSLKKWLAPKGVKEVVVFGDHDIKFGGQTAAFALAHRLSVMREPPRVRIEIPGFTIDPSGIGHDWADAA